MSNIKKIIGVVLALVMALSVATIAFAAPGEEYSVTVVAEKTELAPGESTNVTVNVTANYNVSAMSIPVFFDKSKVTVSEGVAVGFTGGGAEIITDTTPDADVSAIYAGSGKSQATDGLIALAYIAPYYSQIKTYDNEAVMTFKVTANADATGTVKLECVEGAVKTSANPSGTLYVAKNSSGSAEVDSLGEVIDTYTITSATINIGGGAQPELVTVNTGKVAVYNGPVEEYKGQNLLYGAVPELNEAGLADYFTAKDGKLVWKLGTASVIGGTGTICELQDNSGNVVATYTLIIFGDIDGDAIVGTADSAQVEKRAALDTTALSGYGNISANIDADAMVGTADSAQVEKLAALDTTAIDQSIGFPAA